MTATILLGVFLAVLVAVCWLAPGRTANETETGLDPGVAQEVERGQTGLAETAGSIPVPGTMFSTSRRGSVSLAVTTPRLYRSHSAAYWAWRYRQRTRQLQAAREVARQRWAPTVDYALRLASSVFGVSYWQMRSVAWCESRHQPWAQNGQYRGLFQEGPMFERGPFSQFSVFDPIANALTAAHTVSREGWGQWECRP